MFTPDDITKRGFVPGTAYHEYGVERDGAPLGTVRVAAAGLLNAGIDPAEHIAERLNRFERDEGFDALAAALAEGLTLS